MTRIIPGVQVQVVKEVLPPQLAPSGVLGLIGLAEKEDKPVVRASSLRPIVDELGPATVYSIPEARQALANGVYELVIATVDPATAKPASGSFVLEFVDEDGNLVKAAGGNSPGSLLTVAARANGTWADGITIEIESRDSADGKVLDLTIKNGKEVLEVHRNLTIFPEDDRYLETVMINDSAYLSAKVEINWDCEVKKIKGEEIQLTPLMLLSLKDGNPLLQIKRRKEADADHPVLKVILEVKKNFLSLSIDQDPNTNLLKIDNLEFPAKLLDLVEQLRKLKDLEVIFPAIWPKDSVCNLAKGQDASSTAYIEALQKLNDIPDVDMVLAAVQDISSDKQDDVAKVHGAVISHCELMSADCQGRIGFGQVGPNDRTEDFLKMVIKLKSDRFVLVAPHGVVGAVAGMIGNLQYFQSPTFKRLSGITKLSSNLGVEDQRKLLNSCIVPVVMHRERGIIVLRGLTTDKDQISVRRVADRAVRGVKSISELFIGRLNNEDGRGALKQKLIEFLIQMEKDGAIVPKTDGTDPAYKIDVYSSQDDFAKGIVRVDLAVRPVRAIDYIYATILVQV